MASSYTTRTALAKPATNDTGWGTTLNTNLDALDALEPLGALAVRLAEVPSASLNVKVAAGVFRKSDGTLVTYAGTASQAIPTATTKYLYLTDAGTLTVGTAWPATAHVRLAVVVAGATTITSITDARVSNSGAGVNLNTVYLALAGGTLDDGANVATGGTTGTKIGTATTQKLGFWNVTPVVQPASANQAAAGALTTVTLTDSTGGTATTTLGAGITDTVAKDAIASLAAQVNHAVTDLGALRTLLNQLRSDLVAVGLVKGSA